jgi:hypothetical protein
VQHYRYQQAFLIPVHRPFFPSRPSLDSLHAGVQQSVQCIGFFNHYYLSIVKPPFLAYRLNATAPYHPDMYRTVKFQQWIKTLCPAEAPAFEDAHFVYHYEICPAASFGGQRFHPGGQP